MGARNNEEFDFPLSESEPPPRPGDGDDDDPYVGAVFADRYRILSKIAQGAQARVYLARHLLIKRQVAVKVLLPVLASDKTVVDRFLNEGRAAGTLGHPNIVESMDMGRAPDGAPFLVLELLEGKTLEHEISLMGPFLVGRAAYIASQIASAMAAANARQIIHRDLKPENIFLVEKGGKPDHVKVLDFGISKFAGTRVATQKGQFLGTPDYMAPEQIKNPAEVDLRADVYAVGGMLYAMLAGEAPFANVEFPKVLSSIVDDPPRRLSDLRPQLPKDIVAIVEKAMAKRPADRYQTMAEFEDALHPHALEPRKPGGRTGTGDKDLPAPVPAQSEARLVVNETAVSNAKAPVAATQQEPAPRGKAVWAAAAVVVLGALGAAFLVKGKPQPAAIATPSEAPATAQAAPATPSVGSPAVAATTAAGPLPAAAPAQPATADTADWKRASARRAPPPVAAPGRSAKGAATPSAPAEPAPPTAAPAPQPVPVAAAAAEPPPAPAQPAAPAAPTATGPAPGTIEARAVNATVRAHAAEVRGCFDRARMYNADVKGKVTIRAAIAPDGRVSSASVASATTQDARLEGCIASAFGGWQFPAPAGGIAGSVTYTFSFE